MTATLNSRAIITDPFTAYELAANGTTTKLSSANQIAIYPFHLPYPQEVTNICLFIGEADGSNDYDFGIYDADGNLICHAGAQEVPTASSVSFEMTGGPVVIGPGLYFLAITGEATNLMWAVSTNGDDYALGLFNAGSSSSGGALPSTITVNNSLNEGSGAPYQGYPPVMILT